MHHLTFAMKRAHWTGFLHLLRPLAAKYGLTPARFDLLHCIRLRRHEAFQRGVARALGVTEATVSRMVTSMVEAGLLRRRRTTRGRRRNRLRMTNRGRRAYALVLRKLVRKPIERRLRVLVHRYYGRVTPDDAARSERLRVLAEALRAACKVAGDASSLEYPDWGIEDH